MTCKECIHEKVCDALIKSGCPYLDEEIPANVFCMEFRNTADVVPKSEYDAVVSAVDNSTQEFLKLHDYYQEAKREVERLQKERDEYKKHVDNDIIYVHRIKAEVAREIFAEIEKIFDGKKYVPYPLDAIAELKKKYTKENTENENQN